MNTIRLFVFAIALLTTAFLLRALVDHFSPGDSGDLPTTAPATAVLAHPQQAAETEP